MLSQIGYSGLRAAQIALTTSGQNVANANTPGFSRLSPVLASLAGEGGLNVGGGVVVTSIRRMANDFQNQQLWRATTEQSYYDSGQQYLSALEGLMGGEGSSISVGLDNFFAALSEATATPGSVALRQQIINETKNLAQRFNGLSGNIDSQLRALQEQRGSMVGEINGLTSNLAALNKQIVEVSSTGGDTTALRDHRESLVQDLSKYASIRVNEVADGSLTVSLANGQPLVAGNSAGQLAISKNASGEQAIALTFAGTSFPLAQDGMGGSLGALYDTEYDTLRPNQTALHEMAGQFAQMVNDTLANGFDLDGNPGQGAAHLQRRQHHGDAQRERPQARGAGAVGYRGGVRQQREPAGAARSQGAVDHPRRQPGHPQRRLRRPARQGRQRQPAEPGRPEDRHHRGHPGPGRARQRQRGEPG
jgi:flagellar hook-associated protein FlgK